MSVTDSPVASIDSSTNNGIAAETPKNSYPASETVNIESTAEIRRQEADVLLQEEQKLITELEQLRLGYEKLQNSNAKKCEAEAKQIGHVKKRLERGIAVKKGQLEEKKTYQQTMVNERNSLLEKLKQNEKDLIKDKKRRSDLQNSIKQTESKLKDLITENSESSKTFRAEIIEFKRRSKDRRKKDAKDIEKVRRDMKEVEMEVAKRRAALKALEQSLLLEDLDEIMNE